MGRRSLKFPLAPHHSRDGIVFQHPSQPLSSCSIRKRNVNAAARPSCPTYTTPLGDKQGLWCWLASQATPIGQGAWGPGGRAGYWLVPTAFATADLLQTAEGRISERADAEILLFVVHDDPYPPPAKMIYREDADPRSLQ